MIGVYCILVKAYLACYAEKVMNSSKEKTIAGWLKGILAQGRFRGVYELSYELRVPQATVYRWLTGRTRPSLQHCIRLAEVTGTPLEEIVRMADRGQSKIA